MRKRLELLWGNPKHEEQSAYEQEDKAKVMIRVITGYRIKKGADMESILMRLRADAMQYPGFVSAENLIGRRDSSIVIVISTWNTAEDWKEWEKSKARAGLLKEARALLEDETKAAIYDIVPTRKWA